MIDHSIFKEDSKDRIGFFLCFSELNFRGQTKKKQDDWNATLDVLEVSTTTETVANPGFHDNCVVCTVQQVKGFTEQRTQIIRVSVGICPEMKKYMYHICLSVSFQSIATKTQNEAGQYLHGVSRLTSCIILYTRRLKWSSKRIRLSSKLFFQNTLCTSRRNSPSHTALSPITARPLNTLSSSAWPGLFSSSACNSQR